MSRLLRGAEGRPGREGTTMDAPKVIAEGKWVQEMRFRKAKEEEERGFVERRKCGNVGNER